MYKNTKFLKTTKLSGSSYMVDYAAITWNRKMRNRENGIKCGINVATKAILLTATHNAFCSM